MLTHSFEDLAQSFRVLLESHFSFSRLLHVDRAEAIGNLEAGINTQLQAFHSMYDNMIQRGVNFDWYTCPELLTILVIRNARHHNKANKIRTLFNHHRLNAFPPTTVKNYFYVDFPSPPEEAGGDCFDVPVSWADIDEMLTLPRKESHLRPEVRERIRKYLNADSFESAASESGLGKQHIFINYVPLSLNAAIALYPHVVDLVTPHEDSIEAKYFLHHFQTTAPALTNVHEQGVLAFNLPE
ncbi:hypothetical protein [Enterobacter hormaechei]|uniref:hypothetical protein n=1 Tax=Enterobacter hormaechei TaxID=158836 RepID=UPI001AE312F1|nr:hypothetical protein [Enterobacter hormaechei]MBP1006420.1 hypothetical protein [Enterobacter hormaechei]MBP1030390.1 hypothetical protein [Enterobacter hormaechei]